MVQNYISGAVQPNAGPEKSIETKHSFAVIDLGKLILNQSGADLLTHVPNRKGRIIGLLVLVDEETTDGNADGTITAEVSGTVVTGGVVTIADTASGTPFTTLGKIFQGTVITAANTFGPGDYLDVAYATTNAFSDGVARVLLVVEWY